MHKVIGGVGKRYINKRVLAPRPRWDTPIPSFWPEVGKSRVSGRRPVTLCAAAICKVRPAGSDQVEDALITISDRMVTKAGMEYESKFATKEYFFSSRIVSLASGDLDNNFTVAYETHHDVLRDQVASVCEVAHLYARNFARLRRERAASIHLAPFNLDADSFVSRQQEMASDFTADLANRLRCEELGVDTIIAGTDMDGSPHIYSIGGPPGYEISHPICHDAGGFWAVGSGAWQFEAQLMAFKYDRFWGFPSALLLMSWAKKKAESAPGVGTDTVVHVFEKNRSLPILPENVKVLDGYCLEYSESIDKTWNAISERMTHDARLIIQIEEKKDVPPEGETTPVDEKRVPGSPQEGKSEAPTKEAGGMNA